MVQKFATKHEKHTKDDEKRRESLKNKLKQNQSRKLLIKNALSGALSGTAKKIVFDEEVVDENDSREISVEKNNLSGEVVHSDEKMCLFDESDSEEKETYEIKIKNQFEGKKGQKLLNLQSNFNFDERFKLDERFQDGGSDDDDDDDDDDGDSKVVDEEHSVNADLSSFEMEKLSQLKVLENVLGYSVQTQKEKESKKSFVDMVRFDPSNEDHMRRDNQNEVETEEPVKKKKKNLDKEERRKRREARKEKMLKEESAAAATLNEKFYEVTDDLKTALKNIRQNEEEGAGFSLLAAFSKRETANTANLNENCEEDDNEFDEVEERAEDIKCEIDKKEEELEVVRAKGIINEKFFFSMDDPRFEEALSFMNMKGSEEARKTMDSYDEKRRSIREVLRLRWQKHRQRNNPFRNKLGGSGKLFNRNKKQSGKFFAKRKH